jgi:Ca2+-binding RTX toxin-like protein
MNYSLIQGDETNNILVGDDNLLNLNDKIQGFEGNDILKGGKGKNYLRGGKGNDKLYQKRSKNNNILRGGEDNDYLNIQYSQGDNFLGGGAGDDTIDAYGANGNNTFYGREGDDRILAGNGNDAIYGGIGNDSLESSAGDDLIYGGSGNDRILGGSGNDIIYGGIGDDQIDVDEGNDTIHGGSGLDVLVRNAGVAETIVNFSNAEQTSGNIVSGDNRVDFTSIERFTVIGSDYDDILLGGDGNDFFDGRSGNNIIDSGAGDDRIHARDGNDTIDGGTGDDTIVSYAYTKVAMVFSNIERTEGTINIGDRTINFTAIERFEIYGSDRDDNLLLGGAGDDILVGDGGNNTVDSGAGNDYISINDSFRGSYNHVNTVQGGTGNDTIVLGRNSFENQDTLYYTNGDGTDEINDFKVINPPMPDEYLYNDIISFNDIPYIDLVQNSGDTEIRLGDGIVDNMGFGTGDLLMKLVNVSATDLTATNFENTNFLLG